MYKKYTLPNVLRNIYTGVIFLFRNSCSIPSKNIRFRRIILLKLILSFTLTASGLSATSYSQTVTIQGKSIKAEQFFDLVNKQTGYAFVFDKKLINAIPSMDMAEKNAPLKIVLDKYLASSGLQYTIKYKTIIVSENSTRRSEQRRRITGQVMDSEGKPLSGTTVIVSGHRALLMVADKYGRFAFDFEPGDAWISFTSIGYKEEKIAIAKGQDEYQIRLKSASRIMEDVVITGIFDRKKESFTGVAKTVTGEELKMVGNQNVLQSLRSLDPSFIMIDNNLSGSDPNALSTIELRGTTGINTSTTPSSITDQLSANVNTPLFILDGFESTLRQITDLDINRIASITILKDAASTAIYGARSANGVVVVETIKPKPGQLDISYTGDMRVDVPDLRDYNMMNAEEKLEFEVLAGRYNSEMPGKENYNDLQDLYNRRLTALKRGVNTYWLNEPLRTGFTQNHSLYASGGSQEFQYSVGGNVQNIKGVMKGSDRRNLGGRVELTYRRPKFNVTNRLFVSGYKADSSIYGSFNTYVRINPYYEKGLTNRYIESVPLLENKTAVPIANPLYNTTLNSEGYSNNFNIQNNLGFIWDPYRFIRVTGGLQVSKSNTTTVSFISPENTMFDETPLLEKGRYQRSENESFAYSGNMAVSYNNTFREKHVISANLRGELQQSESSMIGLTAVGFPLGVSGNPSFAYSYQPDAKPDVSTPPTIRRVSLLGSLSYIYANKYFIDANYRIDGSTAFGTSNKYTPFWSTGIGWNIHNEEFVKKSEWINMLTLRANIGITGNQNFGSFLSTTVYNIEKNTNYFGQGYYHTGLGNPDLDWQKTTQTSVSLDLAAFNNRFSATINGYTKYTNPLIIDMDLPGSNGATNYSMNAGNMMIKGFEFDIKYSPIYKLNERIIWTLGVTGSMYKGTYGGFKNIMEAVNREHRKDSEIPDDNNQTANLNSITLQQFYDGNSPYDIWAVRSLGIDPGTGQEVFLKKDGSISFDYDPLDITSVGSSRPLIEGVINSSLRYKAFSLGLFIRYNLGASKMNDALYNKVENIGFKDLAYNQDKRALDLRWKNPGDIAQFKGISLTDYTPISSRFVQKENYFSGESISLGYELLSKDNPWMAKTRLRTLRFTGYMNNIFRISNIESERGLWYPFTNSVSFSINALF